MTLKLAPVMFLEKSNLTIGDDVIKLLTGPVIFHSSEADFW